MGSASMGVPDGQPPQDGQQPQGKRRRRRGGCDCDCDVCDFWLLSLVRLSTVLLVAAALVPDTGGTALVGRAIAGYQRWLSRFTAACPSTPNCSAYAASAVREHGARRGLRAAAARLRACG